MYNPENLFDDFLCEASRLLVKPSSSTYPQNKAASTGEIQDSVLKSPW
jgi:hypothetical protein